MFNKNFKKIALVSALVAGMFICGASLTGKVFASDGEGHGGEKVELKVSGMSCGACSSKVKTALEHCDGVNKVEVSHKTGTAVVEIDESKINKEELIKVIKKSGFKAEES